MRVAQVRTSGLECMAACSGRRKQQAGLAMGCAVPAVVLCVTQVDGWLQNEMGAGMTVRV